jgi:hypothetical protein
VLTHLPRRPFSLDPLIAEAKRRMRRRRALLAVAAVVVLGGGAAGATLAFGGGSGVVPGASAASYPGPAVRLASCSNVLNGAGCRSPDRKWSILMSTNGLNCHVSLRHAGTQTFKRAYDSTRGFCDRAVWVEPHLLLFGQGAHRVLSLDAATGKVRPIANFLGFAVSPNEHWIAGEMRPKGAPPLVAAVSLADHQCRVVTQAHGKSENVVVAPGGATGGLSAPSTSPFRQGVAWRRAPSRHGRLSVAVGPGVGFTRDSKGLIVAVNRWSDRTSAYHRKLVQIPLSPARRPCPAAVTARMPEASAFGKWPSYSPRHQTGFPLTLHVHHTGNRVSSIEVTVTTAYHDSALRVLVLRGSPLGNSGPAPNHPAVFQERVRMTNLPGHGDVPAGLPLATWTGTLSPTAWKGGCENKRYEVYAEIRPLNPKPHLYTPQYEDLGSPWFRCQA